MQKCPRVLLRDPDRHHWLSFKDPVRVFNISEGNRVVPALIEIESLVNSQGLTAAGFISYDAASAFDSAMQAKHSQSLPLLWFGLFKKVIVLNNLPISDRTIAVPWKPNITRSQFQSSVAKIKSQIARGETYQVNFTFRLRSRFLSDPWDLFLQMMKNQPCPYGGFIETGEFAVCSASPELFFRLDGERLISKPMKGTMARGRWAEDDLKQSQNLAKSKKNRAENIMIVDMVRNDLGRVARPGSVKVSSQFDVEKYPTLWQMTSTIQGKTNASVSDIFGAMFPAASITGAPKIRTMALIDKLESTPRGLYTGSLGFIAPNRKAQFNVAIRTAVIDKKNKRAEFGVGSGVVWDSRPRMEHDESLLKTLFLNQPQKNFQLLETLLWSHTTGFFLFQEHLDRLKKSANYFSFDLVRSEVEKKLRSAVKYLGEGKWKVRLLLGQDSIHVQTARLPEFQKTPIRVRLARHPINLSDVFLYHKTTHREVYEQTLEACPGYDDVLLWNNRGEITESTTANLVVEMNGRLFTPPIECGLLPGTHRANLLQSGRVKERLIKRKDLSRATNIWLVNSVRKEQRIQLES